MKLNDPVLAYKKTRDVTFFFSFSLQRIGYDLAQKQFAFYLA